MDAAKRVTAKEIAQHIKRNDDRKVIIIEESKSHLEGLQYFYRTSEGREKRETWSLRERARGLQKKERKERLEA